MVIKVGQRRENLEGAIVCYNHALDVFTLESDPERWAMTQHNLGVAYRERLAGDRAANLEKASPASRVPWRLCSACPSCLRS